jgi:hypothetical protein
MCVSELEKLSHIHNINYSGRYQLNAWLPESNIKGRVFDEPCPCLEVIYLFIDVPLSYRIGKKCQHLRSAPQFSNKVSIVIFLVTPSFPLKVSLKENAETIVTPVSKLGTEIFSDIGTTF